MYQSTNDNKELKKFFIIICFRYALTEHGLALAEKLDSEEREIDKDPVEDKSEESSLDGTDVVDLTLEEEEDDEGIKDSWYAD